MNLTPQSVLAQVEVKHLQARPAQHKYSILDYFIGGTDIDTSLQWFDEKKELSNSFLYYFSSPFNLIFIIRPRLERLEREEADASLVYHAAIVHV